MTSAEAPPMESPSPRKLGPGGAGGPGSDGVPRKPSFKCGGPGRGQGGPRVNRRSTSVQALTSKFDLLSSRPTARVVVARPKKFAKPSFTESTIPKPKIVLEPPKNPEDAVVRLSKITPKMNEPPSREFTDLEPIYEKPCLPVRAAIGIFEKAGTGKPAKPVAAIKPILKNMDDRPKPKLAPKDSLCRVRYNVMRRTRERTGEDDSGDEASDKPVSSRTVSDKPVSSRTVSDKPVSSRTVSDKPVSSRTVSDQTSLDKLFVKQENECSVDEQQENECSVDEQHENECSVDQQKVSTTVSKHLQNQCNDVPKENQSSLHRNSNVPSTVLLRKKMEEKTLQELNQRLATDKISVTSNCLKSGKPINSLEAQKKLNDVFNQISQSTVIPSKFFTKKEEQIRKETSPEKEIIIKNSQNQEKAFSRISQSEVVAVKNVGLKERRFATLLKKEVKEVDLKLTPINTSLSSSVDLKLTPITDNADNSSQSSSARVEEKKPSTIILQEEPKKAENLKPNSSFLWSKPSPEPEPTCKLSPQTDKPLPKPPEAFIPDCFYDTIGDRNSLKSDEGTEYDDISIGERNDTYDDIGVASLNNRNLNESLYCISDKLDSLNIYEDIQSLRASMENYERLAGKNGQDEKVYEDACYESIYGGVLGHSDESEKSSFEKNNSLYESTEEVQQHQHQQQQHRQNSLYQSTQELEKNNSLYESSPEILARCGDSVSEAETCSDYQTTGRGGGSNRSDVTDTSNSDDWVEVSDSEPEATLYQVHRKSKRQRGFKPRANWSQLQKRTHQKNAQEDLTAVGNDEHLYESIPQSEVADASQDAADDSSCIDDFESSEDECPDAQLPAEPAPQYNLTKSLRAAGKRLRQNLTLRKSDFSKSLKKLRPRLRNEVFEAEAEGGASKFYCEVGEMGGTKGGQRPSAPPPPPPDTGGGVQYADLRMNGSNGTELYAECGLFKQRAKSTQGSRSSWYTEAGLYGTNGKPAASSGKAGPLFTDEPLYQFYTECVNAQARDDILLHYDSDGYEAINDYYSLINDKRTTLDVKVTIPNLEEFGAETDRPLPSFQTQNRTLWCQVPEVEESCIVATLTEQQRKLQEAKFEILTSEGSYIHSLTVLETHFMPRLTELISGREHRLLFSNILAVKAVSERLLAALEGCWRENIMLMGICDVVRQHAEEDFQVYVKFCKNHTAVYRTLRTLIDTNPAFAAALKQLERSAVSHSLSLHSFLLLPMQRITRLPLLLGGVLTRLDKADQEFLHCKAAFDLLNKIVKECDEEATRMEKCEEMLVLSQQLVFPKAVRPIPIISSNRWLVKRGVATLLVGREDSKMTFGRRIAKSTLHLLLFTDMLVLARPKGRSLRVMDYCPRNLVQLEPSPAAPFIPPSACRHLMLLTLLENHDNKTVEMMLSLALESDVSRWKEAVSPVLSDNPHESVYETWDCPQVIVTYEFTPQQPDELALCIGDIVNVLTKIPDGWYHGERLRDGARGWFPSNHTQEISSPHVRAKNKKQRYKLLALSGSYLQQAKLSSPS